MRWLLSSYVCHPRPRRRLPSSTVPQSVGTVEFSVYCLSSAAAYLVVAETSREAEHKTGKWLGTGEMFRD